MQDNVERVLKLLSRRKADEILAVSLHLSILCSLSPTSILNRLVSPVYHPTYSYQRISVPSVRVSKCHLPTLYSLLTYIPSGSLPTLPESPSTGDETLLKSLEALQAGDYIHSLTLVNEALEQGISFDLGKTEALNLRGSFKYVSSISHIPTISGVN